MPYPDNQSPDDLNQYMVTNDNIEPVISHGNGAEVRDEDGNTYIDLEGGPGANSVGHAHPKLVAAIKDQAEKMFITPGRYHTRNVLLLARRIAGLTDDHLKRTFFVNSGAESVEGAIKLSLKHAHNQGKAGTGIISLQHGFHGRLSLPLSLTEISKNARGMTPYGTFPGVHRAPAPYCFRCPLKQTRPACRLACADMVADAMDMSVPGEAAAYIAEPILGVGGAIVPPPDYFPKIEELCRKRNVTVIYDEVFTGFGRTGKMFAHQHHGGAPDIMTFAKGVGGGVPLAGFIATETHGTAFVADDRATTYGAKNQLGLAAGHAVLDIIDAEGLMDNATVMGERFREGLTRLAAGDKSIGEVRRLGLMIGIEFVGAAGHAPDAKRARAVAAACIKNGVLTATTGVYGNTLRVTPPLNITADQVDQALTGVASALKVAA